MRLIAVGGAGAIGRRLVPRLRSIGHEVIVAGRSSGDVRVDISSHDSIEAMYRSVGAVDGVIGIAASGALDEFGTLTVESLNENMRAKFYGQADLVLTGQHHCADGAVFVLTSGIFADEPWPHVTSGAAISGALHSFVLSAAIELPRGMRANVVSPTLVGESADSSDEHFPGMRPIMVDDLVEVYLRLIEGTDNGVVVRAYSPREG